MSSTEEWCADKLSKLLNEELRISTLNEIKDHLHSIPPNEIKPTVNSLDIPLVFDCLNNTNSEQVDLACEVLSLCLNNLSIGESATKFGISLERALTHPFPAVKLMVLNELERNVKNEDVLVDLCKRTSLLDCIIKCLGSEELSVAAKTANILTIIGCSDVGIKQLTSTDSIKLFDEIMASNEINRMRCFELFVNISQESNSSFQKLNGSGLLTAILDDLNNNDILLRLNIIEILSRLGLTEHGFKYLDSKNVLSILGLQMLNKDDPLDTQILGPGILKFFGNIGHWKPKEIVEKFPFILELMFENLESSDFILVGVSLDAIGYIALSSDGKFALDSSRIVENKISIISEKFGSFPTEITIRALKCIENLFKCENDNSQAHLICRKWYFALGQNPMVNIITKYAKNPFSEIRFAGLNVILSMSNQLWGQEIIKETPGLIEFLMDRNSETHKECKEIKFEIVRMLCNSSIFDQEYVNKFNNFVKEGPFYVQGVMEVAFEGND